MSDPQDWFSLDEASERKLTDEQRALLAGARERLGRLSPPRAEDAWAALIPGGLNAQGEDNWPGTLCLCVPLSGVRHASLQLALDKAGTLVGGWQDSHYAWDDEPDWDDPSEEAFKARIQDGGRQVIREALDWLEEQMHRPFERLHWTIAGFVIWTDRVHTDGRTGWGTYSADSPPLVQRLGARLTRRIPEGYFDPWPDR